MGTKKFRSSAAPKGTKLSAGYQDRTQLRTSTEEDDKTTRVKALEEMVKLGQMEQATFEALRDEIIGGDVKNVHLVKGLDYKLLERVRRGEDVLSDRASPTKERQEESNGRDPAAPPADLDEEFAKMEDKEVRPIAKETRSKKGEMAPPPIAGKKRTRDDILKELKASRLEAEEKKKQSALGPRFMKVGEKGATSRIEKDDRGRELLITVGEDGKVKRKVKKTMVEDGPNNHNLLMPEKDAQPLGMEVPMVVPPPTEDEGDIFEGVGTDYNPVGDNVDEDDSEEPDDEPEENSKTDVTRKPPPSETFADTKSLNMAPPPIPPNKKRNWLEDSEAGKADVEETPRNPLTDPTILAALRKASTITPIAQAASNEEEAAKLNRRRKMLESQDRDAEDMDLDFGGSRFGDQEEDDDKRVKLSVWGGDEGDDDDGGGRSSKGPRKRGAKKRKGDPKSATDVLEVMERRKQEGR